MSRTCRNKDHFERKRKFTGHAPKRDIFRQCPQRKLGYASERIAKQFAAQAFNRDGIRLYPYRCPHCREWHLTKQEPRT